MDDLDQLYAALRNAHAAGDTAAAQRLASYIKETAGGFETPAPTPEPTKDTGFFDMMGRAVVRGGKQTGSLLADVIPAMAAKAVGADEYAARQMAEAAETQQEIAQKYAPRYGELSDVKGAGDILPFIAETVAEQIPNIATAIVPGAGGAVFGGRMAAQQALKTAAAREATEAAAARYATQAATVGAGRGAMGGAFLGSYALNAPEIFQNIYEATKDETTGEGQMEVGAALLAGSVSAALDSILPAALVKQFTPGMKAGVVEKILERSGMAPGIARGATAGVISGAATEAPTEAAQEAISIAAEKFVQENASAWGTPEFNRLVESFVRGGVGGGGISGVAGAVSGLGQRRPTERYTEESTGERSTFDQLDAGEIDELTRATQTADLLQGADDGSDRTVGGTSQRGVSISGGEEELSTSTTGAEGAGEGRVGGAGEPADRTGAGIEEQRAALEQQISIARQYVNDIRSTYTDKQRQEGEDQQDPNLLEAQAYLQDLQAQERELRKRVSGAGVLGAGPGMGPRQLGERRTYELTPAEKAVTEEELRFAGFLPNEIKRIMFNAKPKSASILAKDVLGRVAAGQIKIGNELRAVTQEDIDNAQTPEERARLEAAFNKASQGALFAPEQQMGLDLAPVTDETSREFPSLIELGETGFELERPAGVAPERVEIEAPEETPSVPLNLVRTPEKFFGFLKALKPTAKAEQGTDNFRDAISNFIEEIGEFIGPYGYTKKQKQENQALINEFFDQYSLVSDPAIAASFPDSIKGKKAAEQAQIIQSRTKMPDLTTLTGINQIRADFKDFMAQKNIEKLGQRPEDSALASLTRLKGVPTIAGAKLNELRLTPEASRSPEEKAAAAYFGRWNFGLAMRSAAFDIANDTPRNEMFSGQGAIQAQLFRKYLAENLPPEIVDYFDKSVDEYRYEFNRIVPRMKAIARFRFNIKQMRAAAAKEEAELKSYLEQTAAEKEDAELQAYLKKTKLDSNSPVVNFKPMHPAVLEKVRDNDVNGALDLIRRSTGNRYWLALSNRLLDANLTTSINFDRQAELVKRELSSVDNTAYTLLGNIMDAYPDVYSKYLENTIQNPQKLLKGLKQIKDGKLLPDNVLNSLSFKLVYDKYSETVPALFSGGTYFIDDDIINLNSDRGGTSYYTFFHELIHAATAHAIRNPSKLNPAQKQALKELENLYKYASEKLPKVEQYGFTNLDEFIAEAFTNTEFQSMLRSVKYKDTDSTLWSRFVRFVMQVIGGKDNVLFATLANADILMTATDVRGKAGFTSGALNANAIPAAKKSVYDGTFKTLPNDVKNARKWLNGVTQSRPGWQQAKGGVSKMLENVADQTRKYYLGAFTLRQLQDIIGGRLGDSAQNFINTTETMLEDRNAILQQVSKIKEKWEKFQADYPDLNRRMNRLMIDATLKGIDPAKTRGDARLDAEWDALGKAANGQGQQIYIAVRDFYKQRVEDYKNTLVRNVELSMIARGATAQEIQKRTNELRDKFTQDSIEPYFPLKRFGRFWLQVGKGKDKEFYMFDSAAARNAYRDQLTAKGETRDMRAGNDLAQASMENLRDIQALSEIEKIVDSAIDEDPVMKSQYATSDQKVASLRDSIKDSLEQLYYLTLPNKNVRKMFINRKQVSGASEDMLRAFVDSSFHMAYQHSRFKHSRSMFEQLNAAEQLSRDRGEAIDTDYVAELRRRLNYIMNPTDTGTIPSLLSNVSFAWYLTAPASALVNMLGVPAIGFPVLSARFGSVRSAGTLLG